MAEKEKPSVDWNRQLEGLDLELPPPPSKEDLSINSNYQWIIVPKELKKELSRKAEYEWENILILSSTTRDDAELTQLLLKLSTYEMFEQTNFFSVKLKNPSRFGLGMGISNVVEGRSDDGLENTSEIFIGRHKSLKPDKYRSGLDDLIHRTNLYLKRLNKPLIPPFK